MRETLPCPGSDQLSQLLSGEMLDAEAEKIEGHLAECAQCVQLLDSLSTKDDPILIALRNPPSDDSLRAAQPLIERLNQLTEATGIGASDTTSFNVERGQNPRRLGSFVLLRTIGAGGMGIVYEAEDQVLGRRVAVKVIRPGLSGDAVARQRFLREARASAIEHEHVVGVYQAGDWNGTLFLAMPLLQGESLETRLAGGEKLPLDDVLRIGCEIASGLSAAHHGGLIHRDLKPANVWLEAPGDRVKLLDFGLARLVDGHEQLTHSDLIAGTPLYMAPEQARGDSLDFRADLFSLGCLLFRMATGKMAFAGTNVLSVLRSLEMTNPPRIDRLDPALPTALGDLVERLLAKQPARRPDSADEVLRILSRTREAARAERGKLEPFAAGRKRRLGRAIVTCTLVVLVAAGLVTSRLKRVHSAATSISIEDLAELAPRPDVELTGRPPDDSTMAPSVSADWELFYEDAFDNQSEFESDEQHVYGVRNGVKFEQITAQSYGVGFVHRYPLPGRDFAAEIRVRVQLARFSIRFRDVFQDPNRSHVELLFELDGSWHLNHGMHAASDSSSPSQEITHLLQKASPKSPLLQDDKWTTLRIEAVDQSISLFADGVLITQVADSFTAAAELLPARPELVVGFWSQSMSGSSTLETDHIRIWKPVGGQGRDRVR